MILCDTDIMIEFLKGNSKTKEVLNYIGFENISLSSITVMELYFGALNKIELRKIKKAVSSLEILNITENISEIAIELIEKYSKGHGLTIPDALIGATALYYEIPLYTYNMRDFRYIENMKLFEENK
ncbi:PIN domain-containing protein [Candidatus Pyrohabitans sp.]